MRARFRSAAVSQLSARTLAAIWSALCFQRARSRAHARLIRLAAARFAAASSRAASEAASSARSASAHFALHAACLARSASNALFQSRFACLSRSRLA